MTTPSQMLEQHTKIPEMFVYLRMVRASDASSQSNVGINPDTSRHMYQEAPGYGMMQSPRAASQHHSSPRAASHHHSPRSQHEPDIMRMDSARSGSHQSYHADEEPVDVSLKMDGNFDDFDEDKRREFIDQVCCPDTTRCTVLVLVFELHLTSNLCGPDGTRARGISRSTRKCRVLEGFNCGQIYCETSPR